MPHAHLLRTNLIGLPTVSFASPAFNISPSPVRINGVLEMNQPLFEALDRFDREETAAVFMEHMRVMFGLDQEDREPEAKRIYRANYLRLLRGWIFDSNRPDGAVMKGWVESRFGLMPLFHRESIPNINCKAYWNYLSERMTPRFHNNSIFAQFDLLYEFAQYWLHRFGDEEGKITLYRGANDMKRESQIVEKREKKLWVVRNNSLVSYTSSLERASEFGDTILKIEAPFEKILCFPELLPGKIPGAESEHIVIGGDYISEVVDML
ncbi:MAG: NAD(+)--dinitrogen-reductase ADP-D-ribosyltransferase [Nitrospinae bacterium]|nr:NAD(+)--dinitrogen-reductase ADP-D-ribosyltransferase [Nitrospinota bacterium]